MIKKMKLIFYVIMASSAALAISGLPFMGPVGASRVGFIDGKYVLNPSKSELEKSKLDLVVAGTKDAVLMVESEASGLTEEQMLNAVKFSHEGFVPVIKMIEELAKNVENLNGVLKRKIYLKLRKNLKKLLQKISKALLQEINKIDQIKFRNN